MSVPDKTGKPRGNFVPPGYESRISAFMDVVRFGPTALPGATFLALLFHVERSLSYGKAADTASLSQMTGGIRRRNGSWVRAGSGLKKSTLAEANAVRRAACSVDLRCARIVSESHRCRPAKAAHTGGKPRRQGPRSAPGIA